MFDFDFSSPGLLIDAAALASVALVAYVFGRTGRRAPAQVDAQLASELARAEQIARQVAHVSDELEREMAAHAKSVNSFQTELAAMQRGHSGADWTRLREQADRLLGPTLKLATNLTLACDQLRRQQAQLMKYSVSRIDPTTGLHNRRSFDEQLAAFLSVHSSGTRRFSLAMFSVCPAGADAPEATEELVARTARVLQDSLREDDFLARYSFDEFAVLMPHTPLPGGIAFGERVLGRFRRDLGETLWAGVVDASGDEQPEKLLSRADSALYSARAAGQSALFTHTGAGVRRHPFPPPALKPVDEMPVVEHHVMA
ncbi:MAG TPA: GGDEF domain-containing protein [Lacipirellulaceae bacterium]|mgnify:CR=1 FL=1|nr:GGDEF domain-containing protein [Lacipirellulaceae bacterium]